MAIGTLLTIATYTILAAGVIYGLYMMNKGSGDPQNMDPSTLGDFNITTADEGTAFPLVMGRRKVTGNILWYGNLLPVPVIEEVDTGKDTQSVIVGYKYYLDVWVSLGQGTLTIKKTWIQEIEDDPTYSGMVFNSGNGSTVESHADMPTATDANGLTYCTLPGIYANAMKGCAHVFYKGLFLGENTLMVPTIHYLVERLLDPDSPLVYPDLADGVNPASAIYVLLEKGGAKIEDYDLPSFNAASTYWYQKGYGINPIFRGKIKTRDAAGSILSVVGGAFAQGEDGKFYLHAFDEDDVSVATIDYDNGDLETFHFERVMYDQLYTDYIGTYIDKDQDYTKRTVRAYNSALAQILGRRTEKTVDLGVFNNKTAASKRIWEIMKDATYPVASIRANVPLDFYAVQVGKVVTISNSRYSISNAKFRLMAKEIHKADDNYLTFLLRQKTEELYDTGFVVSGGSSWSPPVYTPSAAHNVRVFQLPYNHVTGFGPFYLMLVTPSHSYDSGFVIYSSRTGSDYSLDGTCRIFCQLGTLDATYTSATEAIDDDVGLTYTPYNETPSFNTIDMTDAVQLPRLALVDNELMGFSTVTLNGDGSITLTGIIRGVFGTAIVSHSSGNNIRIFRFNPEIIYNTDFQSFYLKLCPFTINGVVSLASVSGYLVTQDSDKIITPKPIIRHVNNLDGTFTCYVYGFYYDKLGAGMRSEKFDSVETLPEGKLIWKIGSSGVEHETTDVDITYTYAYTHYFYVCYELNGYRTDWTIKADGEGWSDNIAYNSLGHRKIPYGMQRYVDFVDNAVEQLEASDLKLENLLDVDKSALSNLDYLQWNANSNKFICVTEATMLSATTTTTSSTTTTTSSTTSTTTTTSSTTTTTTV
jgi:hypothetical protein